ncbi:hypothetical protein CPA50_17015 [Marinobacter sp. ANT_B65]|nr:hypothetical protein CPA50_17015 [Marinobacter sp. ANT_B65]
MKHSFGIHQIVLQACYELITWHVQSLLDAGQWLLGGLLQPAATSCIQGGGELRLLLLSEILKYCPGLVGHYSFQESVVLSMSKVPKADILFYNCTG